eukprot:jgi/Mesvir1/19288/Mv10363-RA.1
MASSATTVISMAASMAKPVAATVSSCCQASHVKLSVKPHRPAQVATNGAQRRAGLEATWLGSLARLGTSAVSKRSNIRCAAVASTQWRLKQKAGDAEFWLAPGSAVTIGRREDNDFVIEVSTVSGRHAGMEVDGTGKAFITDLKSTNGTMIVRPDGINRPLAPMDRTQLVNGTDIIFADPDDVNCVFVATSEETPDEAVDAAPAEDAPASA